MFSIFFPKRQNSLFFWPLSILAATVSWLRSNNSLAATSHSTPVDSLLPPPLESYQDSHLNTLGEILLGRIAHEPFNLIATLIFILAIVHIFIAPLFLGIAKKMERRFINKSSKDEVHFFAEILHFVGEVEVIFGLWAVVLAGAMAIYFTPSEVVHYMTYKVNYTEPMFIVVIMCLAATKPVLDFTRLCLGSIAALFGSTPLAWWAVILTVAPILGSFITEPAAMTIGALLLGREFYRCQPSNKLKYATLGLLFVNISVGGTFTNFAAPPVLMVAKAWNWSTLFMIENFAWKAGLGILLSNLTYFLIFKKEFSSLGVDNKAEITTLVSPNAPWWVISCHLSFMVWTVFMAHYPVFFIGGFLFFLGFYKATRPYQKRLALQESLLVGFFLAGLVIHGGLQGWWIQPVLSSLSQNHLMLTSIALTTLNDNAAITYLASLIPDFSDELKYAVMVGALSGGGLTVIANAPNPAGIAILSKYFSGRINPAYLFLGAIIPTIFMGIIFMTFKL
ncbi:MAG: putative Na+/H+ antiporter [Proteobacteria bacterium]|nr:putative Na+/H+ antiporter [Pseudomonadota bacterium]